MGNREAPEPEPEPEPGPLSAVRSVADKRRAEMCLFWATVACQFAGTFVFAAMDQILITHHQGDFSAHARMMSLMGSGSSLLKFLFQPLVGSLIDVHGRKPLLLLAGMLQMLLKGLTAVVAPGIRVPLIAFQWLLGFITYDGFMFARDAAMGDLWREQPKELGRALSRLESIRPFSQVIAPLVGGYLAARSVRLPYALAAFSYGCATLAALRMPETLPTSKRRSRISIFAASPLGAIKLFTHGWRLRTIACLQLVTSVADATRDSVVPVHRMQVSGWDATARARFESLSSLISLPGAALGGPLIARLGNQRLLQLGLISQLGNALMLSRATVGRHFYFAEPTNLASTWVSSALSAMTMIAGAEAGLRQGELQGALSSLRMVVQVAAPFVWSAVFEAGVRAGSPGRFYLGMAVVHAMRLAVATVAGAARESRE